MTNQVSRGNGISPWTLAPRSANVARTFGDEIASATPQAPGPINVQVNADVIVLCRRAITCSDEDHELS
jgi:hypothetical protein